MSNRSPLTRSISSLHLVLAALALLTMPQSYRGGASLAHPHAVFQFWSGHGPSTAEHHHDDEDATHRLDPAPSPSLRNAPPDVPTISRIASPAERATVLGGVLTPWVVLLAAAASALFWLGQSRSGRALLPEIPPPRARLSRTAPW